MSVPVLKRSVKWRKTKSITTLLPVQSEEERQLKVCKKRSLATLLLILQSHHLEDEELGKGLLNSEKDRAEHIMLVDLARNDVNRVCQPKTVNNSDGNIDGARLGNDTKFINHRSRKDKNMNADTKCICL